MTEQSVKAMLPAHVVSALDAKGFNWGGLVAILPTLVQILLGLFNPTPTPIPAATIPAKTP